MKFILVPHGSAGDIHPFVWMGSLLQKRGYQVTAITLDNFAPLFEREGIKVVLTGTKKDYEDIANHPDLWHPEKGFELIRDLIPSWTRKTYPAIASEILPNKTTLIGSSLAYGALIAREIYHVPMISVHLQPCMFLSTENPPILRAGGEWLRKLPKWTLKGLYSLAHKEIDATLGKALNEYRKELGLERKITAVMRDYWMSPDGVLALFPEWFAKKETDWCPQVFVSRFPLYDEGKQRSASDDLLQFLQKGEKPLLFTPGSANRQARHFFSVAEEVCAHLNKRAIFLTPYRDQISERLPEYIFHADYAPFSQVFPHCAAVIHHGGIGSVAQGLSAGVPQLIMAMSHDQPDNGFRLKTMGVGDYLYPKQFRTLQVARIISRLTTSRDVAQACSRYKSLSENQMSEEEILTYIEGVSNKK